MGEPKISVVIHTYNSERFLARVLNSVREFDEILICDMYSEDATLSIAQEFGARVVMHERLRFADPARNFAIQAATHDWVLVVDSDELITAPLREYLYQHLQKQNPEEGIRIPRHNYLMGRFMHGEYPDPILRFFRKDRTVWPPYVHRQPEVDGRVIALPPSRHDCAIVHLINPSVQSWVTKANVYTDLEIPKRADQSFPWWKMLFGPWYRFFKAYVLKGGFRDGRAGYVHARLAYIYKFLTIAKIWESRLSPEDMDPVLRDEK